MTIIIQNSVTELRDGGHSARIRKSDLPGRFEVRVAGRVYIHSSYHKAECDARRRIQDQINKSRHMEETSCDGLLFEVL